MSISPEINDIVSTISLAAFLGNESDPKKWELYIVRPILGSNKGKLELPSVVRLRKPCENNYFGALGYLISGMFSREEIVNIKSASKEHYSADTMPLFNASVDDVLYGERAIGQLFETETLPSGLLCEGGPDVPGIETKICYVQLFQKPDGMDLNEGYGVVGWLNSDTLHSYKDATIGPTVKHILEKNITIPRV